MKQIISILIIAFILNGCIFVAGAAAGAAGIAVVYDHRKLEKVLLDEKTTKDISYKLRMIPEIKNNSHIEVSCFNQIVLLTGETKNIATKNQVEDIVRTFPKVKRIFNQIYIKGSASALTKASDSWITTKIKTEMLATKGLKSSNIKVVTENGTVYLMGNVSHQQAEIAVDISRKVRGVQRVMKIFQYNK
ncbi:BON domain-containing protein [Gammaproteobacteria bacterium]|nr:BON domain-containing protein [Gammaproteobacteria bacterium]